MRAVVHAVYQARTMLARGEMGNLQTLPLCLPGGKMHKSR